MVASVTDIDMSVYQEFMGVFPEMSICVSQPLQHLWNLLLVAHAAY